nr:Protein of uncharacterised function (DUF1190) [Klebsiella pneumoniae]
MHHGLHQRGKEAERTAPKYATREDCVAEFGEGQCQQTPAQAGVAPKTGAGAKQRQLLDAADGRLHDGPPDGRRHGATAAAVQLENPASPAYGQYTDASGKSYGAAQPGRTMNVPKTAMAPKPATTTTVTRGGFGESVAKQSTMQRSAAGSTSSSRSMGG